MNPEEGELRPQLLDRFGLGVDVRSPVEPQERAEIVRRRLAYEADPVAFAAAYAAADAAIAARIAAARERLPGVRLGERELQRIVRACAQVGVDGVRGDVVCARAARTLAALEGCAEVDAEHVRRAAHLALAHRRRRDPLDGSAPDPSDVDAALQEGDGEPPDGPPPEGPSPPGASLPTDAAARNGDGGQAPREAPAPPDRAQAPDLAASPPNHDGDRAQAPPEAPDLAAPAPRDRLDAPDRAMAIALPALPRSGGDGRSGRRARVHGRAAAPIDSRPAGEDDDVALIATLRERIATGDPRARRAHVRAGREGALLCLVVDTSGSMGARRRMARVKGALLGLLRDAYARRDRVAIVAFGAARAQVVHEPGRPLEHAAAAVRALRTGGRTPLAAGLDAAAELIRGEHARDGRRSLAVVLTDGRALDPDGAVARAAARLGASADAVHVIDTEEGAVRLGLARALAAAAGAQVVSLGPVPRPGRSTA